MTRELRSLRRQEHQLRRSVDEYRDSLENLKAAEELDESDEDAMRALNNLLERAEAALAELDERQAELEKALGLNSEEPEAGQAADSRADDTPALAAESSDEPDQEAAAAAAADSAGAAETAENERRQGDGRGPAPGIPETGRTAPESDVASQREVSRLTQLLESHYAGSSDTGERREPGSSAVETKAAGNDTGPGDESPAGQERSAVLLAREDALVAIRQFSRRLAEGGGSSLREPDVIIQVVARRDGGLVGRRAHSLRALGSYQFVSKLSLPAGDLEIRVRTISWELTLAGEEAREYIVILHMPAFTDPTLHVIPVSELLSEPAGSLPLWLPPLPGAQAVSP